MSEAVDTGIAPIVPGPEGTNGAKPGKSGARGVPRPPAEPEQAEPTTTEPTDPAQPWRTLRRQAERRRYLTILTPRRVGKEKPRRPSPSAGVGRDAHHLLRPPAEMTRTASNFPDPEHVRQYLRHSCDLTMSGGLAASVVYPLGVCALAEHYVIRRVGGSSVAAVSAAAAAAAEIGRAAPDPTGERDPLSVAPGFAGLAEMVGWLAGQDVAHQDAMSLAAGLTPLDEGPEQWRLARLLRPAGKTRTLYRLFTAVQRLRAAAPDERRPLRRRVALAVLAGFTGTSRVATATAWAGSLAGWALVTAALVRSDLALPLALVASFVFAVTAALAAAGLSALVAVLTLRDLVTRRAPALGFGLVPGTAVEWTSRRRRRRRVAQRLDDLAGVPAADGVPALSTWLADRLDDLAGIPDQRQETRDLFDPAGQRHDGGIGGDADAGRPALTFGDLWLGRVGPRLQGDEETLRRAAADPEHRVVDLLLTTTNVSQHRPYRFPLPVAAELERRGLTPLLFCRMCLEAVLPVRVVAHLVQASPALEPDHTCPRHEGSQLHELPDPWDVPVALAVRMSMAVPGLLAAVPLATVEADRDRPGEGSVHLHWFADGDLSAGMPVGAFDTLLPRWPTFGFHVRPDAATARTADEAPTAGPGWVLPEQDAVRRAVHWQDVPTLGAFARMLLGTARSWGDASVTDLPGFRGRVAQVSAGDRGDGPDPVPFVRQRTLLSLALRGFAAGEAMRLRFTGSDDGVSGQSQTDRYRWIRLRTALREYRGMSLSIGARLPLYSDLAAGYRVPEALAGWFPEGFEAGSRDPSWPEAAATITHLRALSAGGVLDWDAELGAPPVDPDLRLSPPI
ncbi:MAG: hypothetical protein HY830_11670 [Actinobacteria bacterium]|nr:hypothetical protein [Actinomycetota bacterium]